MCVPVMTYGILTITFTTFKTLQIKQRQMERIMLTIALRDQVRNENLRRRTGVTVVISRFATFKWHWATTRRPNQQRMVNEEINREKAEIR